MNDAKASLYEYLLYRVYYHARHKAFIEDLQKALDARDILGVRRAVTKHNITDNEIYDIAFNSTSWQNLSKTIAADANLMLFCGRLRSAGFANMFGLNRVVEATPKVEEPAKEDVKVEEKVEEMTEEKTEEARAEQSVEEPAEQSVEETPAPATTSTRKSKKKTETIE